MTDRLPAEVTSYVGRATEIREIRRLLGVAPVVTLTGPGGVGKTRLALQVAASARASFPDDVAFIGLAELKEPKLLVNTVAIRLGLSDRAAKAPTDLVIEYLRSRRLLLVLDNCEHMVEACAQFVETLVTSCPHLVVLATSRQSLRVVGERVLPVSPLSVPEPGESLTALDSYDAARLFIERATAVVPSFVVTDEIVEDVIRLCRALDGLPLAIELAAVRLRSLSPRQLADRLNQRFTILTRTSRSAPTRHETLASLIDWSYQLCTERERLLWARASVFSANFHLDAVEAVCCAEDLPSDVVLDVLDGLIDKSILVREESSGQARYRMLETIRQYGEDRLRVTDELDQLRARHRDWFLEVTRQFAANWFGPDQFEWMDRIDSDHADLRQAMDFCLRTPADAGIGLRMFANLMEFWVMRGRSTEGRLWCSSLSERAPADDPAQTAIWIDAFLALIQHERELDGPYETSLAKAAALAERFDDDWLRAHVLHIRGYAALMDDEGAVAVPLFLEAMAIFRRLGDMAGELWTSYKYGLAIALSGDLVGGTQTIQECIDQYGELGEVSWRSWAFWSLSGAQLLNMNIDAAYDASLEVLRLHRISGDRLVLAFAMTVLSGCAAYRGQFARAARLSGAAMTVWRSVGASPLSYRVFQIKIDELNRLVMDGLGDEAAVVEFRTGAAMRTDDAVAYALGEAADASPNALAVEAPLTKREMEVAGLVAKGMTNREIANTLVISLRTAETHIDHIRTKLGFSNRAQIAAWMAAR